MLIGELELYTEINYDFKKVKDDWLTAVKTLLIARKLFNLLDSNCSCICHKVRFKTF